MTTSRFVLVAILLMGSAALAHADGVPVDPQMDVSDPTCPIETTCPSPVGPGQGIMFTVNSVGGGIFMGTNQSGSENTWNSLLITFLPPAGGVGTINCTSGAVGGAPFFPCSQSTEQNGTVDLFYNNFCEGTCPGGITPNDIFTITLNDIGLSTGSWPVGLTFLGYANTNPGQEQPPINGFVTLTSTSVPEPGTITLLGVGLAALVVKRRFRSQLQARS